MKEVTYEEWQKNPTARMMWVWDDCEKERMQRKVLYFSKENSVDSPVIVLLSDDTCLERFQHCAEIEKQRRMTNKELARWMREKPTREAKCTVDNYIYSVHTYEENYGDKEVDKNMVIREDDGEWREPIIEQE